MSVPKKRPKHKRPKDPRIKLYVVYGRFAKTRDDSTIEAWEGQARSIKSAARKAVQEILNRPSVRWLHHDHVTFTVQRINPVQS